MAKTTKTNLKELSTADLSEKIKEERLGYKKAKFSHAVSALDNPLTLRAKRREVARLLTELTRRNKEEQSKQSA
jgi:large subunit ribosomal protein L29